MAPLRETPEFKMGRRGEQVVAAMLRSLGYWIIPSYDYAGPDGDRAPSMRSDDDALPIPDLDTARRGSRRWVEVKTKSTATYTRMTAQYEHGIDLDKFVRYLDVEETGGVEIWLTFYELDTGLVLHQSLDHLARVVRRYEGTKMGRHGMAFFPRSELLVLGRVVADAATPLGVRFELALDAPP
jgi:hypothetical protein